jgi:hypothetical protein
MLAGAASLPDPDLLCGQTPPPRAVFCTYFKDAILLKRRAILFLQLFSLDSRACARLPARRAFVLWGLQRPRQLCRTTPHATSSPGMRTRAYKAIADIINPLALFSHRLLYRRMPISQLPPAANQPQPCSIFGNEALQSTQNEIHL